MAYSKGIMFFKKIKKFFQSPIKFFRESLWFATPYFDNKSVNGNVIIATTLGQLNQAESIIKFNKIKDPVLIILYTNQNLRMPRLIYSSANKNLFRSIYFYELPLKPGIITVKKYIYLIRGYKKILRELKPENIYVMSFSGHYALLLKIAKKMGAKLHLVEEGTATYAPLSSAFISPLTWIEKIYLNQSVNSKGYFFKFDSLHVSFPDYCKKIFEASNYNYFLAHMSGVNVTSRILKLKNKYPVTSNDYIYVSQVFPVDSEIYYSIVVSWLEKILKQVSGKIYIKLHPREMEKPKIMKIFIEKSIDNPRLVIINEPPFLIDPFIYLTEPKGIIGVTSTALVYAPLLCPSIETLSIAHLVINQLIENNQDTTLIEQHLDILSNFEFIKTLKVNDNLTNEKRYRSGLSFKSLIATAEKYYKNKKYYHAIFYWQLAFERNIRLLGTKSLWYYNALNKLGQTYKMKDWEISYIDSIETFNQKDMSIWGNIKKSYIKYNGKD